METIKPLGYKVKIKHIVKSMYLVKAYQDKMCVYQQYVEGFNNTSALVSFMLSFSLVLQKKLL